MVELSQRIQRLKASSTIAFNTRATDMKRRGVDVIAMTAGEPDFQPPEHVLAAAREAIDLGLTKYTPSEGTMALRQAVAAKFERENGLHYDPADQVMISTGGKQVLYNGFMAVLEPGDEVVVMAPYWVSYPAQVELAGGVTVTVRTRPEDGYLPSLAAVEAALTPRTKVILINSPSNPTGAVYPPDLVRGIAELAAARDIWLFSDDLYEHLVYDGVFLSGASVAPDKALLVHGASKGYALTGWRIGFGAGPARLIKAMNKLQTQVTSNANALAQHAALAALTQVEATTAFQVMTRKAYQERRDVLVDGLNRLGLVTPKPQGAFYVMTDVTAIDADETVAALRLLDEAHVGVVPGTDFLAPGQVRLSYATSLDNVREALARIERMLA